MKNRFLFFIGLFHFLLKDKVGFAQINLVPNPSFELFSLCPDASNQIARCQNWNSFGNSPDYFNTCSLISGFAPPNAMFGYQLTHTGNAYAGIVTYSSSNPNYREIIGSTLLFPLIVGQKYFFSFYGNFSFDPLSIGIASNNIGLRFSTVFYSEFNIAPINNFAHLSFDSILSDSVNWHFISGSFIADSAYNYISISNFFQDSLTDTMHVGNAFPDYTYYYIDDVCVTSDSLYNQTWTGLSGINNYQNKIAFFPNPTSNYLSLKSEVPIYSFKIMDALGKIVISKEKLRDYEYKISFLNLNSGIYFINVKTQKRDINSIIGIIH